MSNDNIHKKLLILAGASVHNKLVLAAREKGIYTIVTDNLPDSPAKTIADEAWMLDIKDVDGIVAKCKENNVDGVLAAWIDPAQRPYYEVCERLGLPCYGIQEQFYRMTDKHAFKKMCIENGVDVIPEYSENDLESINYPVFVKPVDSRGSRGQSVCHDQEELLRAIEYARKESSNGDIIIEKYMADAHEFQVTYFFIDGTPYLIRTCDSYCGSVERHLEKVVACAVSPSRFTQAYLDKAHNKVVGMFQKLGLKNGPVFMQGFEDNGTFRFFDPGLRFPGVDYEKIFKHVFDVDLMDAMISIALNGTCKELVLPTDCVWLKAKHAAILFPTISAGTVTNIQGQETVKNLSGVISFLPRCKEGDQIQWSFNVNQRSAEIDCIADNISELKTLIVKIQNTFIVRDNQGHNMTLEYFNVNRII